MSCFLAAAWAGYWVSANLGSHALREQAEIQLGKLLRGDVHITRMRVVIRGGLFLEGERVGVYPRAKVPRQPDLFASHVTAELDVFALLTGRFRLTSLVVDDVVFRIRRNQEGFWSPTPIRLLDERRIERPPDDFERKLAFVRAIESASRFLLERPVIARRIEVRRGKLTFDDALKHGAPGEPLGIALQAFEGRVVHHWLSGDADLQISTVLVGDVPAVVPLRAEGYKRRDDEIHVSITAEGLPLTLIEQYAWLGDDAPILNGTISGELSYDTRTRDHGTMSLAGIVEGLRATIPMVEGPMSLDQSLLLIDAAIEQHPGRLRLARGIVHAQGVEVSLQGTIDRPLRMSSRGRFETTVTGLGLPRVRAIAESIPGQDARTLETLLDRIESGQIDSIGGAGSARLVDWGRLLQREVDALPEGFVLRADLSGIRLQADDRGRLEDIGGHVELMGDRLSLRDTHALWNSDPLPPIALTLDGVSNLFRASEQARQLSSGAASLPGTNPLWAILRGDADGADHDTPKNPSPPIQLRVDKLDHPALRWPVRDALLAIRSSEESVQIDIERASWAGAPVAGSAVWRPTSTRSLTVSLRIDSPDARTPSTAPDVAKGAVGSKSAATDPTTPADDGHLGEWAYGRFEVDTLDGGPVPLRSVTGDFALEGATLSLSKVRADVHPTGKLVAHATLALDDPERVEINAGFSLVAADVSSTGVEFGLTPGFAQGKLHVSGTLRGPLMPQTPVMANLSGRLSLDARDGEIQRKIPLVVALAQASEGFNSYSARDAVVYEYAKAEFEFERGSMWTEDFRIEGPLRVYASGHIDGIDSDPEFDGVIGLFLFRGAGDFMGNLPLVKAILPGSERGLVGAYYRVRGPISDPQVQPMTEKSITEDLPDLLAAPLKMFRAIVRDTAQETEPGSPRPRSPAAGPR